MASPPVKAYAFPAKCIQESGIVYNFAFGSNLSAEKMQSRGISVSRSRPAILRGYKLAFSQLGFPPAEPSYANLEPMEGGEVHGICFELEPQQFGILWHGEGSGAWYSEELVSLECYDGERLDGAVAFICLPERRVPGGGELPPSARYKALLTSGAAAVGLESSYRAKLDAIPETPPPAPFVSFLLRHRLAFHLYMSKVLGSYPENTTPPLALQLFERLRSGYVIFGQQVGFRLIGTPFVWMAYLVYIPEAALGLSVHFAQTTRQLTARALGATARAAPHR
jgi:hypothetical protein